MSTYSTLKKDKRLDGLDRNKHVWLDLPLVKRIIALLIEKLLKRKVFIEADGIEQNTPGSIL